MFRRILIPLDGSSRAERALPVAARLARASASSLVLLRVLDTSVTHYPSAPAKPTLLQTVGKTDRIQAESYLTGIANSAPLANLSVQTLVLEGLVAPIILSTAMAKYADMIVLCSHGFTGVTRWMPGSVAEKVARSAQVPVLVLREGGPTLAEQEEGRTRPLRVLVPLDGSDYAKDALTPAAALVTALTAARESALHLMSVVKPPTLANKFTKTATMQASQNEQQRSEEARQYLNGLISTIRDRSSLPDISAMNIQLTSSVTVDDDITHAIINTREFCLSQADQAARRVRSSRCKPGFLS